MFFDNVYVDVHLTALTGYQLCEGDMKVFSYSATGFRGSVGFAVIETTDDGVILARVDELMEALTTSKQEKSLEIMFLAVVNIISLQSTLLVIGSDEKSLAQAAFFDTPGARSNADDDRRLFSLGGLVSRKKDFIPAVSKAINKGGWTPGQGQQ
jgi:manganese-dependent inorganic pyrophosphatase